MKENPYFKINEFKCKCGKCQLPKGVPSDELIDALCEVREHYNKPVTINSGYRCKEHNAKIGGAPSSQHCLSSDTEILTNNGWKSYKTIKGGDLVCSLNLNTNMLEYVKVDNIIIQNYDGEMINFKTKYVDLLVTPEHRMLHLSLTRAYKKVGNKRETEKSKAYLDKIKLLPNRCRILLANEIRDQQRLQFVCGGDFNGNLNIPHPDINFMKLCLATVADGCVRKDRSNNNLLFRFGKERKLKELESLLGKLGASYSKKINKDGYTDISVCSKVGKEVKRIIGVDKTIPSFILDYPTSIQRELLEYYNFFDGAFKNKWNYLYISSISKHNIHMLQNMCIFCGYKSYITELEGREYNIRGKKGVGKRIYNISIVKRHYTGLRGDYKTKEHYTGVVWCVSNKNTTLVIKRNNKVSIQGNCLGSAVDFTVKDTPTKEVYDWCEERFGERPYGLARRLSQDPFKGFVHLDTRGKKARWIYAGSYEPKS